MPMDRFIVLQVVKCYETNYYALARVNNTSLTESFCEVIRIINVCVINLSSYVLLCEVLFVVYFMLPGYNSSYIMLSEPVYRFL